jgi:4,5-dihydroxyphthalate decarboxylase
MTDLTLTAVSRTQGNNRALKAGLVTPKTCKLAFEEVPVLVDAFRRMVRGLEWDVCEMAITTYMTAKEHGIRFTAIPAFLVRQFHHGAILVNKNAGIRTPKDLEGQRVGVNRGYTVTTGVWARGILASQYGVDLSTITWVLSGDEHVEAYRPPANVVPLEAGKKIADELIAGRLVAAIGVEGIEHPDVVPLIPNALEAGLEALRTRGHYPINHCVVIRDETLAAHPEVAADVFEAFTASKLRYVDELRAGSIAEPTAVDDMHRRVMEITGNDPLPYGIAPNRGALEEIVGFATAQGILTKPVRIEELFAPSVRGLTG